MSGRAHAPWCRWEHDGPCSAENAPPPDHPVWAEVKRLRAEVERLRDIINEAYGELIHDMPERTRRALERGITASEDA